MSQLLSPAFVLHVIGVIGVIVLLVTATITVSTGLPALGILIGYGSALFVTPTISSVAATPVVATRSDPPA
jgi:hypothetical protein